MIHTIRLGFTNSYLVPGNKGYLLIDAGGPGKSRCFFRKLEKRGILPDEIVLIAVTHAHFDHVGSLSGIKEKCSCPIVIHVDEARLIREAEVVIPPGTKWFTSRFSRIAWNHPNLVSRLFRFKAADPDISVTHEMPLESYGFKARIIPTPGHTKGSISIVTNAGDAFVGDLAVNYYPFGLGPYFPPYGENAVQIFESWEKLLQAGVSTIYPAHGKPFNIAKLEKISNKQRI